MAGAAAPTLTTTVVGPTPDYGHDLFCTDDIDLQGREVDGLTCLAQALYRRIISPRGSLIDDPNYGFDITRFLDDDMGKDDAARVGAGVDAELLKDERVVRSQTTATLVTGGVLNLVTVVKPSTGPTFRLVVAATSVTVQLLQVSPA